MFLPPLLGQERVDCGLDPAFALFVEGVLLVLLERVQVELHLVSLQVEFLLGESLSFLEQDVDLSFDSRGTVQKMLLFSV